MVSISPSIRNIGIMAHIDAGKTTTTERILFFTGKISRMGEVHDGNTTMDWMIQEQERGITITAAAISCEWLGHTINIIDTPGHVDFTVEVERSLRVLDGAIAVFDGVAGVEPQSEVVWRQADNYGVARIVFINKLDRVGADFQAALASIRKKLKANAIPFQLPLGREGGFYGVIDLLKFCEVVWDDNDAAHSFVERSISDEYLESAKSARDELIGAIVDQCDDLVEDYLSGKELSYDALVAGARSATIARKLIPVFCGSAFKNKGVQPLLDAVVNLLPSPTDLLTVKGLSEDGLTEVERKRVSTDPLCMLAFKIVADVFAGQLVYVRIYSGKLGVGSTVFNSRTKKRERIVKILVMDSNDRKEAQSAEAGQIVAVAGLKECLTGDTLYESGHPIVLECPVFPEPVIFVAVEPKSASDEEKLMGALKRLKSEDPTFDVKIDPETGQTLISGMGELHLEILTDRLLREFKVSCNIGSPQVSYRETITKSVQHSSAHSRELEKSKGFGEVSIKIAPLEEKSENSLHGFTDKSLPSEDAVFAVRDGVLDGLMSGPFTGNKVLGIKVDLLSYKTDEPSPDLVSLRVAGFNAVREAMLKGGCAILEPYMDVEIQVPEDYMSAVIGDLSSRRGRVRGIDTRNDILVIAADAALSEMFGYSTRLRSLSQGRATYSMKFSHFEEVSPAVAKRISGGNSDH